MLIIAERINGMFNDVKDAIAGKNKKVIQDLAKRQTEAGASYLDVNVGTAAAVAEAVRNGMPSIRRINWRTSESS